MDDTSTLDWTPNDRGVAFLVERGKLEHVEPSAANARFLLTESRKHLASAAILAGTDDVSHAFTGAYDAARKALTAILAVQGLRARGGDGGHAVLLDAVRPQFPQQKATLQEFDWMRDTRNHTEYPDFERPTATSEDLLEAIPAATRIVELAETFVAREAGA